MKQRTGSTIAAPTHFVGDTAGARYERSRAGAPAAGLTPAQNARPAMEQTLKPGRIVVGVDGSDSSITGLRRAIRISRALGASVEAVTTWMYSMDFASIGEFPESPEEDARQILAEAATAVFGATIPRWFTSSAQEGTPDGVLIEQSRGAEMLIVGSRGHGGVAGLLLGSVSARCAERAHCPVLIMH